MEEAHRRMLLRNAVKSSDKSSSEFNPYKCGHCGSSKSLKHCSSCRLISFCNQECQKQYWPKHKDFCQVVGKLLTKNNIDSIFQLYQNTKLNAEWLVKTSAELSMKLSTLLVRDLTSEELLLLSFPKFCEVCYETNPKKLHICFGCKFAAFCIQGNCKKISEEDPKIHRDLCENIRISLLVQKDVLYMKVFDALPEPHGKEELTGDLFTLIENLSSKKFIRNPKNFFEMSSFRTPCIFTFTATILFALEKLDMLTSDRESLNIHVVDCGLRRPIFDANTCTLFYTFMPKLKSLKISFIGSEIDFSMNDIDCFGRNVEVTTHKKNYHEIIIDVKPDLIIRFHSGFGIDVMGKLSGYFALRNKFDTDRVRDMKQIFQQKVPFVFTSYRNSLFDEDFHFICRFVDHIGVSGLTGVYWHDNPFKDLRPCRNFQLNENEPLFFQNDSIMVYDWKENMSKEKYISCKRRYNLYIIKGR